MELDFPIDICFATQSFHSIHFHPEDHVFSLLNIHTQDFYFWFSLHARLLAFLL